MPRTDDAFDHAGLTPEGERMLREHYKQLIVDEKREIGESIRGFRKNIHSNKKWTGNVTAPISGGPIGEFIASMSAAEGFARTSRYAVFINLPTTLGSFIKKQTSIQATASAAALQALSGLMRKQLSLHCDTISMPGHDLQSQDVQHGSAPGRSMVQSHDYAGTIGASFYLDQHLRERLLFELWQKMCVNPITHKANYYDDYIGSMEIYQLDGQDEPVYGMSLSEIYPTTIGSLEYGHGNANQIAKLSVQFAYRQWTNLGIEQGK